MESYASSSVKGTKTGLRVMFAAGCLTALGPSASARVEDLTDADFPHSYEQASPPASSTRAPLPPDGPDGFGSGFRPFALEIDVAGSDNGRGRAAGAYANIPFAVRTSGGQSANYLFDDSLWDEQTSSFQVGGDYSTYEFALAFLSDELGGPPRRELTRTCDDVAISDVLECEIYGLLASEGWLNPRKRNASTNDSNDETQASRALFNYDIPILMVLDRIPLHDSRLVNSFDGNNNFGGAWSQEIYGQSPSDYAINQNVDLPGYAQAADAAAGFLSVEVLPEVPEPAAWIGLLLGFAAIGARAGRLARSSRE